jgi:hypothetical protein
MADVELVPLFSGKQIEALLEIPTALRLQPTDGPLKRFQTVFCTDIRLTHRLVGLLFGHFAQAEQLPNHCVFFDRSLAIVGIKWNLRQVSLQLMHLDLLTLSLNNITVGFRRLRKGWLDGTQWSRATKHSSHGRAELL